MPLIVAERPDLWSALCMTRSLLVLFAFTCATPALACNPTLFERADTPLRDDPGVRLDVAEIESTEGGEWMIWPGSDGSHAEEIARIDYGEMGRWEARLVVESGDAYAITQTRYGYAAPIYAEGAMTIRVETDIFMFCDGELLLPPEDSGFNADYAKAASKARAVFRAGEVADYVPAGL